MSDRATDAPVIHKMSPADFDRIVEIDIKVLGKSRPEYWEMKLELMEKRLQFSAFVAESDGKVVGFIIGGASKWEYGVPENIGWIDTIGVDPDYQKRGIAKALFKKMSDDLKANGVQTIYTLVTRRDWRLLKFFNRLGFQEGDMINLELDI
jgi:ribosomal protein S18 acetylase RimI-like enzyme